MKITDLIIDSLYMGVSNVRGIPPNTFYGRYAGLMAHPDFNDISVYTFYTNKPSYGNPLRVNVPENCIEEYEFTELVPLQKYDIITMPTHRTYLNCDCLGCSIYRKENHLQKE